MLMLYCMNWFTEDNNLKKNLIFMFFIINIISTAVCARGDNSVYTLYVNGVRFEAVLYTCNESDDLYITPQDASAVFALTLSADTYGNIYTFSNKLRTVTYDTLTGSVNISDRNSFLYDVVENAFPSLKNGKTSYIPLSMICNALNFNCHVLKGDNTVHISGIKDCVGLFNSEGVAIAHKGNKYGLVNRNGDIILRFCYDAISNYDNPTIFKLTYNHRCGLVNSAGDFITDIVYNEIIYESPSRIYLEKDGFKGMCDINGYMIIPTVFDDVSYCDNNIAMVKNGEYWHLYNCNSDQLYSETYDEVYKITAGVQSDNPMIKGYYVRKGEKWGCIDSFGNTVIDLKYEALDKFDINGRARIIYDGKFGIIDCGGKIIIPPAFDYLDSFGSSDITVAMIGNKYGILKDDFSVLASFEYDYIYPFNGEKSSIAYKDGKYAIISSSGSLLTEMKYTHMEEFKNGLSLSYDRGYGYVDHDGKEIIQCIHDDVKQGTALSVFLKKDGKWALFAHNGDNLTDFCYLSAGKFSNGLSAVSVMTEQGERYGYVNDSGDVVIPLIYTSALEFKYGKAIVSNGKYSGIIDVENRTIIPFVYTGFNPSYDYNVIAAANDSSRWGLISFNNDQLCEFKYDYIFEFVDGYAYTLKNNMYGIIDIHGHELADTVYSSMEKAYNHAFS